MSNRSVKVVPAVFAGVVAGANLATMTDLRAQVSEAAAAPLILAATDSCLSAPKAGTPSGGHWYYRIDRATKRQCWYLREENDKADDKFARAAPPDSSPASAPSSAAAESDSPQQRTIPRKSIADARAEWVSQQGRAEPNLPVRIEARSVGAVPSAVQESPRAAMPNVLAPTPLSTMRWSDGSGARAAATPANLQTAAAPAAADQPPQVEEAQQPAAEPAAPAAVEPAAAKPTASLQMLLLVMAAALALAGLTVSAIVRIGRMRARRAMRRKRRAMWDSAKTKTTRRSPSPPMFQEENAPLRRTGAVNTPRVSQDRGRIPRERPRAPQERLYAPKERPHVPQERPHVHQERPHVHQERPHAHQERDRERQVTEMLARLARSAQT
jgi:hypothetical protein